MKCKKCNTEIAQGACHMEHQNNGDKYHLGCFLEACKGNPILKLICKVKCA